MAGLRTTLFMINDIKNILYALKKNSIKNKKGLQSKREDQKGLELVLSNLYSKQQF